MVEGGRERNRLIELYLVRNPGIKVELQSGGVGISVRIKEK